MLVQHHGRVIQVKALPIGIPYTMFETLAKSAPSVYGENSKVSTLVLQGVRYGCGFIFKCVRFTYAASIPYFVMVAVLLCSNIDIIDCIDYTTYTVLKSTKVC